MHGPYEPAFGQALPRPMTPRTVSKLEDSTFDTNDNVVMLRHAYAHEKPNWATIVRSVERDEHADSDSAGSVS